MRSPTMFARLLTLFLVVILACVGTLSILTYLHLRNIAVESRMDALKTQARDIAYLASRATTERWILPFLPGFSDDYPGFDVPPSDMPAAPFLSGSTEEYIRWKTTRVYEEYNAYTIVVDRSGQSYLYYNESTLQDESLKALPDKSEIAGYLEQALKGQEVVRQTQSSAGPLFTVLVPWMEENLRTGEKTVMGFVLIQTAAQTVHASYRGLTWQTALAAGILLIVAGLVTYWLTRQMTRPLTAMAQAAGSMAGGQFDVRAPETGTREIVELSQAFNRMGAQLSTLEQSRRDFVANVSHELRSPITSIQGFAQGMLDGTIPEQQHPQYLQVVVDETHRLAKLIHNLLNLSRMENEETSLALSDFDVNELTRRVLISRVTQIDEKQLEMAVEFEEDACFVHADADQIQQVLINLLDNAIKFTPAGGTVTLSTRVVGDHVSLRVKDTGVGILPEDAPHIFDRFYKADKAHTVGKGTGLGLAICARIMEKHGQSIRLLSGTDGAEFEITLAIGKNPGGAHGDTGAGKD